MSRKIYSLLHLHFRINWAFRRVSYCKNKFRSPFVRKPLIFILIKYMSVCYDLFVCVPSRIFLMVGVKRGITLVRGLLKNYILRYNDNY